MSKISGILLDTAFILPSFGICLGRRIGKTLEKLAEIEEKVTLHYSTYNLLEAVLVVIREVRRNRISKD